jgi:hypothetical protein
MRKKKLRKALRDLLFAIDPAHIMDEEVVKRARKAALKRKHRRRE